MEESKERQIIIGKDTAERLEKYGDKHGLSGAMWDEVIKRLLKELEQKR